MTERRAFQQIISTDAAGSRQLAAKCATYLWTGPNLALSRYATIIRELYELMF